MEADSHNRGGDWLEPYTPINVLKPVAANVWIVDGPKISFGLGCLKIPFTTRMTVVRLRNGELVLHSPVAQTSALQSAVEILGPIRYLVSPNSLHYWWIPDWKAHLPGAVVLAVRGVQDRAKRTIVVDSLLVGHRSPWPDEIDVLTVRSDIITEAVLFHRATRTLVLTDLIENFEPKRIRSRFFRLLLSISGVTDPDGKAPIDMQLSFLRRRKALRLAVQRMIAWNPERVIISHGRWYEVNGAEELKRAFCWVL
ncbi:DUF4336 domain-containing protein [Mesorhizobium sp. 131-2-1]|uniref:DUF4336 domain-containing protein n=1 Tax=Mesorhizobium sp. 131-2-1 TaxID=2744518 RepID=UPI0018EAF043|nr:DUF4336 domain-containing protein [Mesorhizobium sp. 131-2-1]BCG97738.1 hypothetical protein MesoLj131a_66020 [Mesorhizobium sp. 131-2-1]